MKRKLNDYDSLVADAIIGIDTLWGGDVNNPSGTGRFIADSYFSGAELPALYADPAAKQLREGGGVTGDADAQTAARTLLERYELRARIGALRAAGEGFASLRGAYVTGLADSLEVMLDLALEVIGDGPPVSYERAVRASTGEAPMRAETSTERETVARLLAELGEGADRHGGLQEAVDAWRAKRRISREDIERASDEIIPRIDALTERHVMPHLPDSLAEVPRANITFVPIENAWFSGSMNYHGRRRDADGNPEYEASYEINASLEISAPEFEHLVSHEVVPGHVTTFAFLQHLYHIGKAGFEVTIQAMNARGSTLSEGIANNALFFAHGIRGVDEIEDPELRLGVLLSLMQDKAKNNASYLLYAEGLPTGEVAKKLREECLVSVERAEKLAGAWGSHPLLGRMYLPCYDVGTRVVGELLREHGPERVLPAVFGALGPVDVVTVRQAV